MSHAVRERLARLGPQSLTAPELLEALLGSATRATLPANLRELAHADVRELTRQAGVGPAKAAQLVAAFELGRRAMVSPADGRWTIRSARDIADRLSVALAPLEREELHVVLLNTKNAVIRESLVYRGNVSTAVVRIGELFRDAVRVHAAGLIVVHNHPSGDPEPSADDIHLTAEAIAAGRLLDVAVLDHVVIGSDGYVSLRDRGLAF